MKWLAIALVLGNVGYFSWEFNGRVRDTVPRVAAIPSSVDTLRLLNELEEPPLARPEPNQISAPIEEPLPVKNSDEELAQAVVCYALGPVENRSEWRNIQRWLEARVVWMEGRIEAGPERQLFWVYLEPASASDAQQSLRDLREKGFQDYMLIKKAGSPNAISLGVFSSQDSVTRRLAELADEGYQPVVVPRYQAQNSYFIDIGAANPLFFDELVAEFPFALNGNERTCSEIAMARANQ